MNKVIKNITVKWTWEGDDFLIKGFNIAITPKDCNPVEHNEYVLVLQTIAANMKETGEYIHTFYNVPIDEGLTVVPWVQALYENDDSEWASLNGVTIEDDGQATIVVIGNPNFQQIIDMASDDKITPQEKQSLKKEWDEVITDHWNIYIGIEKAGIGKSEEKDRYIQAANALAQYLNDNKLYEWRQLEDPEYAYPVDLTTDETIDLNSKHYGGYVIYTRKWREYYEAKIKILEKIRDAIAENNKDSLQDIIDQTTLPDTIPVGGYLCSSLTANKLHDFNNELGYIRIGYGSFVNSTGQKYYIERTEDNKDIATHINTALNSNTGKYNFLLFIGSDPSRFEFGTDPHASKMFVIGTHKRGVWYYHVDGSEPKEFNPLPEDCVVARIEEFKKDSTEHGIQSIKYLASTRDSIFDALTNGGEEQGVYKDENTGKIFINAEYMRIGVIKSQNDMSEFNLNDGTFRLGGTVEEEFKNFKLKFDGKDLKFGKDVTIGWENIDDTIKDNIGSSSHAVSLSNDSHIILCGLDGNAVPGELGADGKAKTSVKAFKGSRELVAVSQDTVDLTDDQFKIKIMSTLNCTVNREGNATIYIDKLTDSVSSVDLSGDIKDVDSDKAYLNTELVDSGYVELEIICGENKTSLKKMMTFTKVKNGSDGVNGTDGQIGDAAKFIKVNGEQIFKYADGVTIPTPAVITLKSTAYNMNIEKRQWQFYHEVEGWKPLTGDNDQEIYLVNPDGNEWRDAKSVRYRCVINELYIDEITIAKLKDGDSGYTVSLSNESHSVACDEFGGPLDGEIGVSGKATCDVTVYKGTTQLTPVQVMDNDYTKLQENEFAINITEYAGCEFDLIFGKTLRITKLEDNSAYVNMSVICESKTTVDKVMTITKAIKGSDGVDGASPYIAVLTNDYHAIPTDEAGENGNYNGCSTSIDLMHDREIITEGVTYGAKASTGVLGLLNKNTYTVTRMDLDAGYVDMVAMKDSKKFTKRFTLAKNKQGNGADVYSLDISHSFIKKDNINDVFIYSPSYIILKAKKIHGNDLPEPFAGKFKVFESVNGSDYEEKLFTEPILEQRYEITTENLKTIKVSLYNEEDFLLDTEVIPVVSDGKKGDKGDNGSDANVPDWVKEWDGNSTLIGGDKVISPRIFAGAVDSQNRKTGIALGRQALANDDIMANVGLAAYSNDVKTMQVEARTGKVTIGAIIGQQMIVYPDGSIDTPSINANKIIAGTIDASKINVTNLNANNITAGSINARNIDVYNLNADNITAGKIKAKYIEADEIVSTINGASTTINGDKITTGTIALKNLNSNNDDAILKLFDNGNGYCSIDATYQYEQGRGNKIRLKWNSSNYWYVGENTAGVYLNNSEDGTNGEYKCAFWVSTTHARFSVNKVNIGTGSCRIDTQNNALRLYTSYDGSTDRGIRISQSAGRAEVLDDGIYFTPISAGGSESSRYKLADADHNHNMANLSGDSIKSKYGNLHLFSQNTYYGQIIIDGGAGTMRPASNGNYDLGTANERFSTLYVIKSPNVSSDVRVKRDLTYIDNSLYHQFIRDDLDLATYNYLGDQSRSVGFIAQDLVNNQVGELILDYDKDKYNKGEENLSYNLSNYISVVAGALKHEIEIRDKQIDILIDRINKLEGMIENNDKQ